MYVCDVCVTNRPRPRIYARTHQHDTQTHKVIEIAPVLYISTVLSLTRLHIWLCIVCGCYVQCDAYAVEQVYYAVPLLIIGVV